MSIKHDRILNPITALEFFQDGSGPLLILAGEGSYLKIFNAETSKLLSQCEVFCNQTIHGIAVCPSKNSQNALQLVVWGGSYLQLIRRSQFEQHVSQEVSCITDTAITAPDWILDASIAPHDSLSCALVTAHNTVLRARLDETADKIQLEALSSPSRSILYSAHLTWESDSHLLIAAGTVFGEIVVWECSLHSKSKNLFTFTGHEGSIFGVNISPPIFHSDGTVSRLLASCSDDRTIHIWNLDPLCGIHSDNLLLLSETGFGPKDTSASEDAKPIAVAMAHASRIWRVKFLTGNHQASKRTPVGLLSFGEDSTTVQWDLELNREPLAGDGSFLLELSTKPTQLELKVNLVWRDTFAFHSGKHIWSPAVYNDGIKAVIGTGGADGKISMFETLIELQSQLIEEPIDNSNISRLDATRVSNIKSFCFSWDIDDIFGLLKSRIELSPKMETSLAEVQPEDLPVESEDVKPTKKNKPKKVPKDTFNKYTFISKNCVLVTTTFGRVLHGHIDKSINWTEVGLPSNAAENLRSYSVVAGFPEIELAYFGAATGNIFGCNKQLVFANAGKVNGKVADMFKIYDPDARSYGLLVTILMSNVAKFFRIDETSLQLSSAFDFMLPEKFIITSASKINGIFVFGSRFGSIALYDPNRAQIPLMVYNSTTSGAEDAITTILPLSLTFRDVDVSHFLITRRDGVFSIFSINISIGMEMAATTVDIHPVHEGTPPFGPMIENAWFKDNDLYLYGFKSKKFIVWNETKQCEVTSIECGGAHRSYDYSSFQTGGHFIYTKASKLYLYSHAGISHRFIKPGGHGREIKSCAVSLDQNLIATGAEDTAIRIWNYNSILDDRFNCEVVVQKHTTGIQHLQWHGSNHLISSGGNEEFFIFKVSTIPGFGIGVVCEATCPDQSEEKDLRITCFDIGDINSLSGEILITLAYSDSTLRSYAYSKAMGFKLLATGKYTSSCITQLRHLSGADGKVQLLTGATDGYLALWSGTISLQDDAPNELSILSTNKIHQSTIKSLSLMTSAADDFVFIVTGGDDNALGFLIFPLFQMRDMAITPTRFVLRSAHAAAITGLSMIGSRSRSLLEKDLFRFITSGNDQRVKIWEAQVVKRGEGRQQERYMVRIKMVAQKFTAVADVGGLTVFHARAEFKEEKRIKTLVVGNGMEIWDIKY